MVAGPGPGLLALALALWPAGLWARPRLQEAGGGQRAPGDSVTLSCRGSGFTFEDYYIFWFRQAPGGSPEWVSFISSPKGTIEDYGAAVKDRAKMSRDNSRSEAYLSLRPLQAQDSARYFCAVPRGQEMHMSFNTNIPARGCLRCREGLWAQPRLQEAGGGQRAPGDSVTLSCRGSGFTFEDRSIWWYRQFSAGTLEWVSYISRPKGTTKEYGAAVMGRSEMSRDNSRSEVYLSLRSVQARDAARYFCAVPRRQEMQMSFNKILPARGCLTFCAGCSPMVPAWLLPKSCCPSESTLSSLGSPQAPLPQCHDQTFCEHLQAQRLQQVPVQPVPVFGHPCTVKKHLSLMFSESLL
ncbi:uncharacterized protein LOC141731465 [Zonotrichia albicollis]|uniref:uncharacterized protein LOC141731465 n=1 Tax=Zonotrichia albicollis TaxID=44394 RepID=UPI003D80F846